MGVKSIFDDLMKIKLDEPIKQKLYKFDSSKKRFKIYAALTSPNDKILIFETHTLSKEYKRIVKNLNNQRSFLIGVQPCTTPGFNARYTVKLEETAKDEIFYRLFDDIITSMEVSESDDSMHVAIDRINSWILFFKSNQSKPLSENAQIGLFAELKTLKNVLESNLFKLTSHDIVKSWEGPNNDNHDFVFPHRIGFEVKCTSKNNTNEVKINNVYQLDNSTFEKLFLIIYQVKKHKKNSDFNTLPDLVDSISRLLQEEDEALLLFHELLYIVGYLDVDEAAYQEYSYEEIGDEKIYHVTDDFPKICSDSLVNEITKVEYVVNIQEQKKYNLKVY